MLVNFVVLTALHLLGIRSYDKLLISVDIMLAAYIVVLLGVTISDYWMEFAITNWMYSNYYIDFEYA